MRNNIKGCRSKKPRYVPLGSELRTPCGYTKVKVRDTPRVWKYKHILIWEKAFGKIPKGHAVMFADKDRSNLRLENLLLVSRRELGVMNLRHLVTKNKDLTKIGKSIAGIKIAIADRKMKQGKGKK
jgi:hypothetical protein